MNYRVLNGIATVEFDGDLLGRADSAGPDKDRWMEVAIYRTVGGAFVLAGCGRSCVMGETDLPWAKVLDTAEMLVEALYRERNGDRFMPHTNQKALTAAAAIDPLIRSAFGLQHVA